MSETTWPDALELDDTVEFDGDEYVVVGTGPGEATLDRVDDESVTMEVFLWAITGQVGIELETTVDQDDFADLVENGGDER